MLAHGATPNRGQTCVGITLAHHRFPLCSLRDKRRKRGKIEGRRASASSCAEQKQAPMKGACE
ncbi:hypothetical protein AMS64_21165 [Aeromonas veronii]|nr:hypothetical protein AMS64_21165 [Aeromonas veronii]POG18397.1 hypothetical protein C2849_14755 [Aeromonas veronii]